MPFRFHILPFLLILLLVQACMKDKPEELPSSLTWNPELAFPLGDDSFGLNAESGFDTTLWQLDTLTDLPQWLSQIELAMQAEIPLDLSSLNGEADHVERVLFRLSFLNDFPHAMMTQAYFLNIGDGSQIDSLFSAGALIVPAGKVDAEGRSTKAGSLLIDAVFEEDRIPALFNAYQIRLQARIQQPEVDSSLIEAYREYEVDVDVGIMAKIRYDF